MFVMFFLNSPSKEKIWSRSVPEFGEKEGCIFTIKKAIYGTRTAAKAFHDIFADCLRRMDFLPTRADQDLWYIKSKDYDGYDYITTHIDDFMIESKKPSKYMTTIQQDFLLRNIEESPSYYLGMEIKLVNGKRHLSQCKYIKEVVENFRKSMSVSKKRIYQYHQMYILKWMSHHCWIWMELGNINSLLELCSG